MEAAEPEAEAVEERVAALALLAERSLEDVRGVVM